MFMIIDIVKIDCIIIIIIIILKIITLFISASLPGNLL